MALFDEYANRIPGPVSEYGAYQVRNPPPHVAYDGRWLSHFMALHGGNPDEFRSLLRLNRIGAVIRPPWYGESDLYYGKMLRVPQKDMSIPDHPES
jgi:hypothetical protein